VTVEILREGPRHNQILSPLTHYLALCEDSPAARLVLPESYEQEPFERRLAELRYEVASDDPSRLRGVLEQTGTELGKILGGIPGLAGALISNEGSDELIHLRLVISVSELARIPFELSKVPTGGGASPDEWLALYKPICITRRNRSVAASRRPWDMSPRILFVSGPGVDDAFDQHLAALTDVLTPWSICPTEQGPTRASPPWLTVLPNASLQDIEQAMSSRPAFVHVLAHGGDDFNDRYGRFGVALTGEIVSGSRLASALSTVADNGEQCLPAVVTLATCDSANEASPIPPDQSVAHALHSRGIPLVVASQFPLSVEGSVPFVEVVYGDLVWGRHPLQSLYRLRLRLHAAQSRQYHDWGAITAYEALPSDIDLQLDELRYWQSRRAHESALQRVEALARPIGEKDAASSAWVPPDDKLYGQLVDEVQAAAAKLPQSGPYLLEGIGLRAAGCKRLAEVDFRLAVAHASNTSADALYASSAHWLQRAHDDYRQAAQALLGSGGEVVNRKVSLHWMLTQVVATGLLFAASGSGPSEPRDGPFGDLEHSLWTTARLSAQMDRKSERPDDRAWAHVSLTELALLRVGDDSLDPDERARAADTALENARQVIDLVGRSAEQAVTTRRQIDRYVTWWGSDEFASNMAKHGVNVGATWRESGGVRDTARAIVTVLRAG
jgi:hypothetical protein